MENDNILLGKIKEIHQYKLVISLPHNKTAVCQLTNISETYREILQLMTKNEDNTEIKAASLMEIFTIGQTIHTKMMKPDSKKLNVSLVPSDINAGINMKHMKNGMKLQVAIKSREDKGYILETGISGINGFMPFNKCSTTEYSEGQLVEASPIDIDDKKINKNKTKVVNFTTLSEKIVPTILTSSKPIDFSCILLGTLIKVSLKLSNDGSLEGNLHGYPVTVKQDHQLIEDLKTPEQTACVIGIDSALKQLDCSLLLHLLPPYEGGNELISSQIGHSETNCSVKKIQKHQIIFSLPNHKFSKAIVNKEHLDITIKDIKVGDKATIRYMDFNLMDNIIRATCLKRLLALSYFSVHQAKLGEIINATVKGFKNNGFSVQISSQLSGFIPSIHLSDKAVRSPALSHKSGDKIKCRVFYIDHDNNKLILTLKKSFMQSTLSVAATINDLRPGMVLDGFVAKISEFGLLVVMFNNLKGWVRKSQVPEADQTNLALSFYCGKPVQVRFVRSDKRRERIDLSLLSESEEQENEGEEPKTMVTVNVGEIHECVLKKVMKNGYNVRLMPSNKPAFLTYEHLSDSREHRELFKGYFSACEGKEFRSNVVVINTDNDVVTVSRKRSLISAATDATILANKGDVSVGSQWLGWVTKKESYGVFVELPSGVVGLVPNKNICDLRSSGSDIKDLLAEGDTVSIVVLEFDSLKPKKSLFTMLMSKTYRSKDHMEKGALDFLANHLEERGLIQSSDMCAKLAGLEIGQVVDTKVTAQLDWGFTLSVGGSVPGFVRNQHLPAMALSVGSVHRAVIVDLDLSQQTIEVCMTGSVVNAVANKKTQCTKIQLQQTLKSDVLAVNGDFVVAMLLEHGNGHLVYIPTRRFWNDISKQFSWIVNQRNRTVIKRALSKDTFIASLSINETIETEEEPKKELRPVKISSVKSIAKKVKLVAGERYPVYFHSITKTKVFFHISKKQKCFCDLLDYSEKLEEIDQLIISPPSANSLMPREMCVVGTGHKGTGLASGHFLQKEVVEKGDSVCCRVTAVVKKTHCRVRLPLELAGTIDMVQAGHKVHFSPRVGQMVQCVVEGVTMEGESGKYVLSVAKVSNYVEETETVTEAMDEGQEDGKKSLEERNKEGKRKEKKTAKKRKVEKLVGEIPEIVSSKREEVAAEGDTLANIYKRVHGSDDEMEVDNLVESGETPICAKRQRLSAHSQAERELAIREAEKRRESGDTVKCPQNETEFELLVFNYPNSASSWTKYMHFTTDVDKARAIAERAIRTLNQRDLDSRYRVMVEYVELELRELAQKRDELGHDDRLTKFQALFERCLIQKARAFYVHVCKKTRSLALFELAEKIAKRFVKDFRNDVESWFQLAQVRFDQKKFDVVRETLTNAERLLKADHFRDLQMRMAQVEIERGSTSRATQALSALMAARPKDVILKNKCTAILENAGLLNDVDLPTEMEN